MISVPRVNFGNPITGLPTSNSNGLIFATPDQIALGSTFRNLYALNDDACVLVSNGRLVATRSFDVFVIDASGAYTWYASAPYIGTDGHYFISNIIYPGPGLFSITVSDPNGPPSQTYVFTVANLKLNNATPFQVHAGGTSFSNPCYNGAPKVYYDAVKNILGAGFYNPEGGFTGQVFSSNYNVGHGGTLNLLTQGWVGSYFVGGTDPWDLTDKASSGAYKSTLLSNGINLAINDSGGIYTAGVGSFNVDPGLNSNTCQTVTQSHANVRSRSFIQTSTGLLDGGEPDSGGEAFYMDSAIPGVAGVTTWAPNFRGRVISGSLIFDVPWSYFGGVLLDSFATMVLTRKYVFAEAIRTNTIGVSVAPITPGAIYSGSNLTKTSLGLVNFTRPISLTGRYKA